MATSIISAAPADTFTIRDPSGQEMAAVQFGHGGNQQAESLPGGEVAFSTGFQVYLPLPGGEEIEPLIGRGRMVRALKTAPDRFGSSEVVDDIDRSDAP